MGIYDREYYRGETTGGGWWSSTAPATRTIILINAIVFVFVNLFFKDNRSEVESFLGASYNGIFHYPFKIWQLLTAAFLHVNIWHIVFNMYFLWCVGRELEAMYGTRDFLAMYLGAAVFSTFCWAVLDRIKHGDPALLQTPPVVMYGASGAVLAAIVVYALYYPHQKVLLFFIIPVEIWHLLAVYLGYQALVFIVDQETDIALVSHLSGAAFGYAFKTLDLRWTKLPWRRVRRPRLRVIAPEPREHPPMPRSSGSSWSSPSGTAAKPATTAVLPEEQLDAKLDEVLAKIAREGRSGLTEEENRVLQEASRRARNRRSDR